MLRHAFFFECLYRCDFSKIKEWQKLSQFKIWQIDQVKEAESYFPARKSSCNSNPQNKFGNKSKKLKAIFPCYAFHLNYTRVNNSIETKRGRHVISEPQAGF